jgi:hypothetical protein
LRRSIADSNCHGNGNSRSKRYAYGDSNGDTYTNGDSYSYRHFNANSNAYAEGYADAATGADAKDATNAAAATIVGEYY